MFSSTKIYLLDFLLKRYYFYIFYLLKSQEKSTIKKKIIGKMSLWDPEAAGNAAQYLRLPEKDMLEIRNQPFDGAKEHGFTTK